MNYTIGADLGTSAIKLTLVDEKGRLIQSVEESYPLILKQSGYSEQDPQAWVETLKKGLNELSSCLDGEVLGLCIDGQMHGLVALDENMNVIRPCILWNDSRSKEICDELNKTYDAEKLLLATGNIAYPGFTLPKILWMKKYEKDNYDKIRHVLLPKDYLNYVLTSHLYSDFSDAAGTLLYDVKNRVWSKEMITLSGLDEKVLPEIVETGTDLGLLNEEFTKGNKMLKNCHVYQGAADNAAAAIGNGVIEDNECNISLGTSGTIYISTKQYSYPKNGAIHSFSSATGSNCLLACMLSAASCLKWFNESILKTTDYKKEQESITFDRLGHNNIFFLPYLMGERSPINDSSARGVFFGLSMDTTRYDMTQSILEGVAFALKDSFIALKEMGIEILQSYITGG